jgi:hypothetical protein
VGADPEVRAAWKNMCEREEKAFNEGMFAFAYFFLGRNYSVVKSKAKAQKLGWTGYQDSWEAYSTVF